MPITERSQRKLAVGIGSIISLMAGLLFLALSNSAAVDTTQHQALVLTQKMDLANSMLDAVRRRSFHLARIQTLDDYFDRDAERQQFRSDAADYIAARDKLLELGVTESERAAIDRFQGLVRTGRAVVEQAIARAVEDPYAADTQNRIRAATALQSLMFAELRPLVEMLREQNRTYIAKTGQNNARSRRLLYGLGLLILVAAAGIAILVVNRERAHTNALMTENRERRQAEEAIRILNASLERRVERRTAELRHAMEDAEIANEAKSQFLRSMSHELRTPLNAILGFARLLNDDPDRPFDDHQHEEMGFIMKAGQHLLELIDQVLDLNKIETGMTGIAPAATDARPLIDECVHLCRANGARQSIHVFDRTATVPIPTLWTDSMRFKQILLNLLSNAVKYNRPGGTVTVDFARVDGMARISVRDTGLGIADHRKGELFKPFERLGHESGNIQGTGIGLNITRHLVTLLGGRIGFSSAEGNGSMFWFDVPVCDDDGPPDGEKSGHRLINLDGCAVLYVEENPANRHLIELILGRIPDLRLLPAANAQTGLAIARQEKPDLILMNAALPDMSGAEAAKALRAESGTRHIPVIAVAMDDQEIGTQAGFHAYLTKPLDVSATLRVIEQTIRG